MVIDKEIKKKITKAEIKVEEKIKEIVKERIKSNDIGASRSRKKRKLNTKEAKRVI